MQVRHQGFQIAMGANEFCRHVRGMRSGVTQPRDAVDLRESSKQTGQRNFPAARIQAVIGVHVLPEQAHFAGALVYERFCLADHVFNRPRVFRPTRVRHHAKRAKSVTPFLDREEGSRPRTATGGQLVKLAHCREVRANGRRLARAVGSGQEFRQPVVGLWADHDVDFGTPTSNFRPFRLGHAAGDDEAHAATRAAGGSPERHKPAQIGVDLLRRFLADMAGIQHDQVGSLRGLGTGVSERGQHLRHPLRIVDVHLAAVRTNVHLACG